MLGEYLLLGGLLYALRKNKDKDASYDAPDDDTSGRSEPEPTLPPKPLPVEGDDYRVELVAVGEQNNIYLLQARYGVMYDDGSGGYIWQDSGYLRGNADGYVTAPSALRGTITFTIGGVTAKNAIVYATEQEALDADKIPEDDPSGPQKQPEPEEDDDTDNGGGLTIPPGYGSGLGGGHYRTGPIGGGI